MESPFSLIYAHAEEHRLINKNIPSSDGLVKKFDSYASLPSPSAFGVGVAQVMGSLYVCDGVSWSLANGVMLSSSNTAAQNTALIQNALNVGGDVFITAPIGSVIAINTALLIDSNTHLKIAEGVEIKASGTFGPLLVSKSMLATKSSVSITWTSGITATVNWTGHGLTISDRVWIYGATQFQFNGVFYINSITDANSFVIQLRRLPTTAATGSITALKAARNIWIEGGIWNYNYSGGNTGTPEYNANIIRLGGISGLRIGGNIQAKDSMKYLFDIGCVQDLVIDHCAQSYAASDSVKVFGPAFDLTINCLTGITGDDCLSLQTLAPPPYTGSQWCYGDIIGASINNVSGKSATSLIALYSSSSLGYIDGVTINTANGYPTGNLLKLDCDDATATGNFGVITINGAQNAIGNIAILGGVATAMNVKHLVINSPSLNNSSNLGRVVALSPSNTNANITVNGGYATGIDNLLNNASTGTVTFNCNDFVVGTSWNTFNISGTGGTTKINIKNLSHESNPGSQWLNTGGTPTVYINADKIETPSGTQSVNKAAGATFYSLNKGWKVDLSIVGRVDGAIVYNSNAALGTLGVAGLVVGQGTAANSWHLMSDPTKVY